MTQVARALADISEAFRSAPAAPAEIPMHSKYRVAIDKFKKYQYTYCDLDQRIFIKSLLLGNNGHAELFNELDDDEEIIAVIQKWSEAQRDNV
jgi:hypothetical protein